ncbi:metabolite traffic protein EboE [Pseudoalteromonas sp. T1lg65]|uniref:metabolite traffic protein EboE n=1 Tax=Pseudoalteromonas sp. T1lg65 TaxID=2077101 RepID=UPI003F7A5CD0
MSDSAWLSSELGYCTNVHSGETLQDIKQNLATYSVRVRQLRHLEQMEVGLWLPDQAAKTLLCDSQLTEFKRELESLGLQIRSLNGFPYGGFHQQQLDGKLQPVKREVYQPDWCDERRLIYSSNLLHILNALMPDDCDFASISTLPLGDKQSRTWDQHALLHTIEQLKQLTLQCATLHNLTGKRIVFAIEMEPGCVLEHSDELLRFFKLLKKYDENARYVTVCLDICHLAVSGESPHEVISKLQKAGIEISKVQLSNAIELELQKNWQVSLASGFAAQMQASPWLHQTSVFLDKFKPISVADFSLLFTEQSERLWQQVDRATHAFARVHCHVPLFAEHVVIAEGVSSGTTQTQLIEALRALTTLSAQQSYKPILEIETYSWSLFLEQFAGDLCHGITTELAWVELQLKVAQLSDSPNDSVLESQP